jgi:molybdate transport system substrate-binding protein
MQIRLFSGNGMRAALAELGPRFEAESGYTLAASYDPAKILMRRIDAGESADVVLAGEETIDALIAAGKVDPASRCRLTRNAIGLAVRRGASRPDIATLDAFKRTLLMAPSIAYTTEGASGIHFAQVIERLGIAEAVRAKARTQPGGLVGDLIVAGEAELAIQQIPELLAVPGIDLVGPLPPEAQKIGVTAGGVFMASPAREAAAEFLAFLQRPGAVAVFRARGFEAPV